MGHFYILVVGENPEKQIEKYNYDQENGKWNGGRLRGGFIKIKPGAKGILGTRGPSKSIDYESLPDILKDYYKNLKEEKPHYENGVDQALKADIINLTELVSFVIAVIKNGVLYEINESMDKLHLLYKEDKQSRDKVFRKWGEVVQDLINEVSDDTLISIFDIHD